MTLSEFTVENYRAFTAKTSIKIRPITLFFGFNSSGKSALLRLLPFLTATAATARFDAPDFFSEDSTGRSFASLGSKQSGSPLSLGFSWRAGERRLNYSFRLFPVTEFSAIRQIPETIEISSDKYSFLLKWDTQKATFAKGEFGYNFFESIGSVPLGHITLQFENLTPSISLVNSTDPHDKNIRSLFKEIHANLQQLNKSVRWLEAIRARPPRNIPYQATSQIETDGSGAIELLATEKQKGTGLDVEVSNWFQTATNQSLNIGITPIRREQYCYASLTPVDGAQIEIDIQDTGEGMLQVLPVIASVRKAMQGIPLSTNFLCIEQPELHLHVKIHSDLARLFIDAVANSKALSVKPIFLIETHSESFLMEMQLAILKGILHPADVLIHWVRQGDDGVSTVDTVELDEWALPTTDNWPTEAFEEELNQARELALLRKNKEDERAN